MISFLCRLLSFIIRVTGHDFSSFGRDLHQAKNVVFTHEGSRNLWIFFYRKGPFSVFSIGSCSGDGGDE